jgi:hypothetical protein
MEVITFVLTQFLTRGTKVDAVYWIIVVFSELYSIVQRTYYECIQVFTIASYTTHLVKLISIHILLTL